MVCLYISGTGVLACIGTKSVNLGSYLAYLLVQVVNE
jgi:hypothetical protein